MNTQTITYIAVRIKNVYRIKRYVEHKAADTFHIRMNYQLKNIVCKSL